MDYISHLLIGFISAFISLLVPGMLNMTAVKTAIEQGRKSGAIFSAGVVVVIMFQASIALVFANYISQNPNILKNLRVAAIVVFFVLAVLFFIQARKNNNVKGKTKKGNLFFIGMFMSVINMLSIPFYFGLSTYLSANHLLIMEQIYIVLFIVGVGLGSVLIFFIYVSLAKIITKRAKFMASNINYILSGIFLVLGLMAIFRS